MKPAIVVPSAVVFLCLTLGAGAQSEPPLTPGQRVRVTAAAPGRFTGTLTATLMNVDADRVMLFDPQNGAVTELPTSSILRLEVSQGRRRHTRKGLLIGTAVGLGYGAFVYASQLEEPQGCGGYNTEPPHACSKGEAAVFAGVMAATYAGAGAFLGHHKQTEVWSAAPVERLKVTLQLQRDGGRIGMAFRF
jgi:hypothetical protein